MKAVICPVCGGSGIYWGDSTAGGKCHGCDGRGWLSVEDNGWEMPQFHYPKYTADYQLYPKGDFYFSSNWNTWLDEQEIIIVE